MNVWGVEIYYPNMIVNIIKTPTWYTFLCAHFNIRTPREIF